MRPEIREALEECYEHGWHLELTKQECGTLILQVKDESGDLIENLGALQGLSL